MSIPAILLKNSGKKTQKKPAQKKKKQKDSTWFRAVLGISMIPVALFLLPLCAILIDMIWKCGDVSWFLYGMLAYFPIHLLIWRPHFLHVTAHEFTHALFTTLSLGNVYSLHIDTEDSGHITMSKRNIMISLAPYFFPLLTMLILLFYMISIELFKTEIAFIAGFFLGCHYIMNLRDLTFEQPDIIQSGGTLFALPLVMLLNLVIFIGVLYIVSGFELNMMDLQIASERITSEVSSALKIL
jgi:hypothetical protein